MQPLTELERAVLELFLDGDGPGVVAPRSQLAVARVRDRELTGVGFFTRFWLPANVSPAYIPDGPATFAVHAQIPKLQHGAGFVLFLKGGRLDLLEGYTYDEPWPDEVAGFVLRRD